MATSTTPDISKMTTEQLAAFVAEASKALADQRQREDAERQAQAMQSVKKIITDASMNLHQAGEAVEAGDVKAVIAALAAVIDGCREAVKGLGGRAPRKASTGNGNGTQRGSAIRDEITQVFTDHPGQWFTATQLVHEMPDTENGPRSSGAVLAACESMVKHNQAEEADGRPRRFRAVQA